VKIGECEECGDWPIYVDDGGLCSACRDQVSDKAARTKQSRYEWATAPGRELPCDHVKGKL